MWINSLTLVTAIGAALIGGTFFGFSNFIMPALARQPAAGGIASMQAINVTVLNPVFLTIFVGTALAGLALIVVAFIAGHPGRSWLVAGALLYIIGTFGVTMARNVPMNDLLAALPAQSPEAEAFWARYLADWTLWNTIRTLAATAAAICFVLAFAA